MGAKVIGRPPFSSKREYQYLERGDSMRRMRLVSSLVESIECSEQLEGGGRGIVHLHGKLLTEEVPEGRVNGVYFAFWNGEDEFRILHGRNE